MAYYSLDFIALKQYFIPAINNNAVYRELYMKLSEFVTDTAIFMFGRMNPPTLGHQKVIETGHKIATEKGADFFVFPSKTHDNKKNPLVFESKVEYLRSFFPKTKIMNVNGVNTIFQVLEWLGDRGYSNVYMVAGSDRQKTFESTIREYIPAINPLVDPDKAIYLDQFEVINVGERNPDINGIEGVSGSKAREYAVNEEKDEFNKILPSAASEKLKEELYNEVRKGLMPQKK